MNTEDIIEAQSVSFPSSVRSTLSATVMTPRKTTARASAAKAHLGTESGQHSSLEPTTVNLPFRSARAAQPHPASPSGDKIHDAIITNNQPSTPVQTPPTPSATLNTPPPQPLDFFIFGAGSQSELGLGTNLSPDGKKPIRVSRPRLHHLLNAADVVQVACGGMHSIALTQDNKILTWGINDDKNLARDTTWESSYHQEEADEEEFDGQHSLNLKESIPLEITYGPDLSPSSTIFTQVAASSAASFVLTATGQVYGWGTFRCDGDEGKPTGFLPTGTETHQITPTLIPGLENITKLVCGADHVLALDSSGKVWSWGAAGQGQLGRRIFFTRSRDVGVTGIVSKRLCLKPELVNFPFRNTNKTRKGEYAVNIATGSWHSFLITNHGMLYGWGMNNFSQTGRARRVRSDGKGEGEGGAIVELPTKVVLGLDEKGSSAVKYVAGGQHHSVVCMEDERVWSWGRVDGHQTGHGDEVFRDNEGNVVFDGLGRPRILLKPGMLAGLDGVVSVAAGTDTSFAVTRMGEVYSWGFTGALQAGHGPPVLDGNGNERDVEIPMRIENSAVSGRRIVWAGAGGQFSMLAAVRE